MELALIIGQLLLKYGPDLAKAFVTIAHAKDPTAADWHAVCDTAKKSYDDYMNASAGKAGA